MQLSEKAARNGHRPVLSGSHLDCAHHPPAHWPWEPCLRPGVGPPLALTLPRRDKGHCLSVTQAGAAQASLQAIRISISAMHHPLHHPPLLGGSKAASTARDLQPLPEGPSCTAKSPPPARRPMALPSADPLGRGLLSAHCLERGGRNGALGGTSLHSDEVGYAGCPPKQETTQVLEL